MKQLARTVLVVALGVLATRSILAQGPEGVRFEVDQASEGELLRVAYFLRGMFGGYGGYEVSKPGSSGSVTVPIRVEEPWLRSGRAESLKAIVYMNGCEFATFTVDPIPQVPDPLQYQCRKLGTVSLRGVVLGNPRPWELSVRFRYVGVWSNQFFGITDGNAFVLQIAEAIPDRDGKFEIELPDLANDGTTRSYSEQAEWSVAATGSGFNERYELRAAGDVGEGAGGLPIEIEYPVEIQFIAEMF